MDPQVTLASLVASITTYNARAVAYCDSQVCMHQGRTYPDHAWLDGRCARCSKVRASEPTFDDVQPIEDAATSLRDWMAVGGFAPIVSSTANIVLHGYAETKHLPAHRGLTFMSRRVVRECLRLIRTGSAA